VCGIVGQTLTALGARPDRRLARIAVQLLKHRGPDDDGVFEAPGVFFGHTRLAITGISRGHQPVGNETGTVQAVFNGEIYNHHELRRSLAARGHRLDGESDSAVLPHAYEEWGLSFAERLEGIFAIALWDATARRLVLCRDRFGVKPLYYAHDPDGLSFGSELKAIAVCRDRPPALDAASLGDYLAFGYVPPPRTILRGVQTLPPATLLSWRAGRVELRTYWSPQIDGEASDVDAARERIEAALTSAVSRECRTETAVGAFLSGGLDSSAIAALMAEQLGRGFPTFHVGFDEAGFGEQAFARRVSAHLGTDHHEILCTPDRVRDVLPSLVWHLDNPVADLSAAAEFLVAGLAKRDVKVVLSGDGGDEVLAGYPTYKADRIAHFLARAHLTRPASLALAALEPIVPVGQTKLSVGEKLRRFRRGLVAGGAFPHVHWRTVFSDAERRAVITGDLHTLLDDSWGRALTVLEGTERWPALTRWQWLDMRVWLDGCVLRKVDALAMAHAIEVRVPFLDHGLVEAALSAPPSVRLRGWTDKDVLRRMMRGRLPEAIHRRAKAPFQMPLDAWLRGPLAGFAREQFSGGLDRLPVNVAAANALLDRHNAGESAGAQLWTLMVLASWAENFYGRLPQLRAGREVAGMAML
jgi:asparagine synthase (glutamine-hydrolysing)